MSKLINFLELPDVKDIKSLEFINDRIGEVEIRAMDEKEHSRYQQKAFGSISAKSAKTGEVRFDTAAYNLACVANHMITPNFRDAKFLDDIGEPLPEKALLRKLLAGEIEEIANRIKKLSGFDKDINDEIEEAQD